MSKKTKLTTVLLLMLITGSALGACSTVNDFCQTYEVVPTLKQGTEIQKLNTDKNNAVYYERCM